MAVFSKNIKWCICFILELGAYLKRPNDALKAQRGNTFASLWPPTGQLKTNYTFIRNEHLQMNDDFIIKNVVNIVYKSFRDVFESVQ